MAYASKYYDPAKAHEYYMQHRQLKGRKKAQTPEEKAKAARKSTKTLNDQGKAVAKQVKEAINEERKAAYKQITQAVSAKIKELRNQWKAEGLSPEEIKARADEIRAEAKEQKKQIKALFEEKYLQELDKIKADPQFKKAAKSTTKKTGKKRGRGKDKKKRKSRKRK